MRRFKPRLLCAAILAVGSASGYAQSSGQSPGVGLRVESDLIRIPIQSRDPVPLFVEADVISGRTGVDVQAEGNAILRRRGQAVFADYIRHTMGDGDLIAQGSVVLVQRRNEVRGPYLFMNLDRETGFMDNPVFLLTEVGGRGSAERIFLEGEDRFRAERGRFTTCGPENEDWYMRADELMIDQGRNVGNARNATLVFQGVPIFYSPAISFPLANERKSGFLWPTIGTSANSGATASLPYYWNIAPNRDATITPRVMAKRGVQLGTELRYLDHQYYGNARVEVLPNDRVANDETRYALSLLHNHTFSDGWGANLNVQKVSDSTYFTDLGTTIAVTSQTLLPLSLIHI